MSEETSPRLRLGLQGWPHPEWVNSYFPEDLPEDWQFNYYANEASCLLLSANDLDKLDASETEDWQAEAPEHFRFYLLDTEHDSFCGNSLATTIKPSDDNFWLTTDSGQIVAILPYNSNLRTLRVELQQLPNTLEAIIFTGDTNPQQLHDIRTLTELLGIA